MVNVKEAIMGKYLKPEHILESKVKVAVIIGEGQYTEGQFGRKLQIDINFNKIKMVWSPNSVSCKNISDAYGEDSAEWIGKKVEFTLEKAENGKDIIVAYPLVDIVSADKVKGE
jgi:hypothetical protein